MSQIFEQRKIPAGSIILVGDGRPFDYVDSYAFAMPSTKRLTTDYFTYQFFGFTPAWVRALLRVRDTVVSRFGLKRSDSVTPSTNEQLLYEPGVRPGLFTVTHRTEDEIVMGEPDRHLDFRVSVLQKKQNDNEVLVQLTTVVWFNNKWGNLYFSLIRPFHRMIVRTMLRSAKRRILTRLADNPHHANAPQNRPLRRCEVACQIGLLGSAGVLWMGAAHFPMAHDLAASAYFSSLAPIARDFLVLLCLCVGLLLVFLGSLSAVFSVRLRRAEPLARLYFAAMAILLLGRTVLEVLHPVRVIPGGQSVLAGISLMILPFLLPVLLTTRRKA